MADAHRGRGISDEHFDIVMGHIVSTMKELNVPQDLIDEAGALLTPLRPDCVNVM